MKLTIKQLAIVLTLFLFSACGKPAAEQLELYIGTYTAEQSEGIYRLHFNTADGTFTAPELVVEVDNPSYLAFSPDASRLYAVSEGETDDTSALNAYAVEADGSLTLLSRHATGGAAPCYVKVAGDYVYTANYLGGSVSVFPINPDGSTGEAELVRKFHDMAEMHNVAEGKVPHLHGVFEAGGNKLYMTDLGLDMLHLVEPERENGKVDLRLISTIIFKDGFGPRHMTRSDDGKRLYVLGELSGEIEVYDTNGGRLQIIRSDSVGGGGCADIHLSPDGRFLYASNRLKEDGISTFAVDAEGLLTKIDYTHTGIHPRNFTLTPDGGWLLCANRDTDNIQIFERNAESGKLTLKGEIKLSMPVCLLWK